MELKPIARNTDPQTSHKAASKVTESGKRISLAQKCLEVLRVTEGLNQHEITAALGMHPAETHKVNKRLSDLKNSGLIFQKGERGGCGIWYTGNQEIREWNESEQSRMF